MNTTRIRQALDLARSIISDHTEEIEENSCLADAKGQPRIETMTPAAKPDYRRCLRAVKLIDDAITEIEA